MVYFGKEDIAYHVGIRKGEVPKYVLLCGDPKRTKLVAEYFDNPKQVADIREFVTYTGTLLGEKVAVSSTGIGGPSAAISITELSRCGGQIFIRIGTCGGMDLNVKSGDLVIATSSTRTEGTSKEYAYIEWPAVADYTIVNELVNACEQLKLPYHVGTIHCKDSFYGQQMPKNMPISHELIHKWDAFCQLGCLASEMESAALFVVANHLKVKVGTILLVIHNQERQAKGLPNEPNFEIDRGIRAAIECFKNMIRKEQEKKNEAS